MQLLRKLREAATPNTRLVIVDNLMSFACVNEELKKIPGALPPLPPAPLLPNGGHSSTIAYFEDIQVRVYVHFKFIAIADGSLQWCR